MFRRATVRDAPFVTSLVRKFYVSKNYDVTYGIPFDYSSCYATVLRVIENGVTLLGKASCAGATINPFPFNYAKKVAYVQFWYFEGHKEIKILDELQRTLTKAGADQMWVVSHPPHRISRLYRRLGFREVEGVWAAVEADCQTPR